MITRPPGELASFRKIPRLPVARLSNRSQPPIPIPQLASFYRIPPPPTTCSQPPVPAAEGRNTGPQSPALSPAAPGLRKWVRFVILLSAAALAARAQDPARDLEPYVRTLLGAYAIVEANAADPVSTDQLFYEGAIPGLLRNLDPHSTFFDSDQFDQLKKMEASTEKGFGSVVSILPGRIIVLQTLPGTPSAKSGLAPGDDIVSVNNYEVDRLAPEQIVELLMQSRQQKAQILVRRSGSAGLLRFTLTPEDMQTPSVDRAFFVGPGIGYIRVASFEEKTAAQLKEAIDKLGGKNLAGLVLDLRNNPGGLVGAAIDTASLFLQPGADILTVRGRNAPEKTESVPSTAQPYAFKLAILINEKTASAAEIVTGALQDHDRAVVLGEPSYGKGLVQAVFPLGENTGLALTTALYYTPSGRSIQKPLDPGKFELAAATAHPNAKSTFKTDSGRTVEGGGGIRPDEVVLPEGLNRFRAVLEGSASFANFATEYLRTHKVERDVEVTPEMADLFRTFLYARQIQPNLAEWIHEQSFIYSRVKVEIINQAIGVEEGDKVEAERDPVIQRALEALGR